jgi:hypothetical protein
LAKHRAIIVAPSIRSVVILAVAGAILAAVTISALGLGNDAKADQEARSTGVPAVPDDLPSPWSPGPWPPASPSASPSASTGPAGLSASPAAALTPSPRTTRSPSRKPTPTRAPTPKVTSAPVEVALTAHYAVSSDWGSGFVTAIEVANPGAAAADWTVEVDYGAAIRIAQVWNATVEQSGNVYRFRANPGTTLGPSQKVQFGYIASGPRGASRATKCTVNGRTCR